MIDYGKLLHHDMIFVCAAVQQMIFRGDTFACISRERERERERKEKLELNFYVKLMNYTEQFLLGGGSYLRHNTRMKYNILSVYLP